MKKILLLLITFVSFGLTAQIEVEEPKEVKVEPVPYDGSYGTLNLSATPEMVAGLVGEKVTIFGITYTDFK